MKKHSDRRLSDSQVIKLRKDAHSGNRDTTRVISETLGVKPKVIERAVRGASYIHLNEEHPPFVRESLKDSARQLYLSGLSYNEIQKKLHVNKSAISRWCSDLAGPRYQKYQETRKSLKQSRLKRESEEKIRYREEARKDPSKKIPGRSVLIDDDIIKLRLLIKADDYSSLKSLAKQYLTTPKTIKLAVTGKTYSHLDSIESPFTGDFKAPKSHPHTPRPSEQFLDTLIEMRKQDSWKWSWVNLSQFLLDETSSKIRGDALKKILVTRDSSLASLVRTKPKRQFIQRECVVCERMFETRNHTAEICFRKRCRSVVEEENTYEQEVSRIKKEEPEHENLDEK
jgi:transposase